MTIQRNLLSTILTFSAILLLSFAGIAQSSEIQSHTFRVSVPDPVIEDGMVKLNGYVNSVDPGNPQLPLKCFSVIVHPDIDWKTLEVKLLDEDFGYLPESCSIKPAPPAVLKVIEDGKPVTRLYYGEGKTIEDGKNMDIYGEESFYPENVLELLPYSQLRKWKMARMLLCPVQYNPATGEVRVTTSVTIIVTYRLNPTHFAEANDYDPLMSDTAADAEAKAKAINFDRMKELYIPRATEEGVMIFDASNTPMPATDTYDYCIITTDYIVSSSTRLQDYIDHKEGQFYSILVKTVEDIESEYTMASRPELFETTDEKADRIKAFLKDKYITYGIEDVLLIGNPDPDDFFSGTDSVGDVPMKFCYPDYGINPYYAPTDSFYTDLTGQWDLDGDGIFGEWNGDRGPGGVDFAGPELFVTRIPNYSTDLSGLDSILEKIITYETVVDESWKRKCFMPNPIDSSDAYAREGNTSPITMAEFIKNTMLIPEGFYYYRIYEHLFTYSPINVSPPPEMVPSALGYTCFTRYDSLRYFKAGFNVSSDDIANYTITAMTDGSDATDWNTTNLASNAWLQFKQAYASDQGASYVPDKIVVRSDDPDHFPQQFKIEMAWNANFSDKYLVVTETDAAAHAVHIGPYYELEYEDPGTLNKVGSKRYVRLTYTGGSTQSYVQINEFLGYVEENKSIKPYVIPEWQNGYGIVYYNTHGSSTSASEIIYSSECWQLDNTKPSFVFQKACSNASPEASNNLCYQLLEEGAIGSFGATRISYGWGDHGYRVFLPKLINENKSFGRILGETRETMENNNWYGWDAYYFDAMRFNIYGDPTTRILTDRDLDGMPYWWEEQYGLDLNLDDGDEDPDEDGATNYEEFVAGTQPNDAESVFKIIDILKSPTGALTSTVTITWNSVEGKVYVIEYSDDEFSSSMTWTVADTVPSDGDGITSWTDVGDARTGNVNPDDVPYRYYRVYIYVE